MSDDEEAVLEAAAKIQNGVAQFGQGFREIFPALGKFSDKVFQSGGGNSLTDFVGHAGPERVRVDIVALMIAAGLGDILVQSRGRKDWDPEPEFFHRYKSLLKSGHLTASRGQPTADHLSAYDHPGAKWVRR